MTTKQGSRGPLEKGMARSQLSGIVLRPAVIDGPRRQDSAL